MTRMTTTRLSSCSLRQQQLQSRWRAPCCRAAVGAAWRLAGGAATNAVAVDCRKRGTSVCCLREMMSRVCSTEESRQTMHGCPEEPVTRATTQCQPLHPLRPQHPCRLPSRPRRNFHLLQPQTLRNSLRGEGGDGRREGRRRTACACSSRATATPTTRSCLGPTPLNIIVMEACAMFEADMNTILDIHPHDPAADLHDASLLVGAGSPRSADSFVFQRPSRMRQPVRRLGFMGLASS